ncbi:diacylglycerol kinase family protein [Microbacterium sp. KSW2-21]|uniref:Diacylglycerol kinase family protein n=1 Tax=Microbacterium algihabitans TaxID=3075992 RepID=A0ABU3S029_9MICO|nr:diacylglycerol kinase family protein [Microbacterium sp. KSW2-21]MDU0328439.1 diacylglycerol kinase family protein [Microbacterium sp. KSW2-21]
MTSSILITGSLRPATRIVIESRVASAALIVNAAKFTVDTLDRFRAAVEGAFTARGRTAPLWLPTSAESTGTEQAREAIRGGVDLVLVAGGDGTIRTVGQELAGTGIALALLPIGTGNLLARNLGIPRNEIDAAVHIALHGKDLAMDVGWAEVDRNGDGRSVDSYAFLVMGGAGFDAATMSGASSALKRRLGSAAYLLAGALASLRPMVEMTASVDGVTRPAELSRGIVVGNHGSLTMGLALLPEATCDDGRLDGVILLQRNAADWLRAFRDVAGKSGSSRQMPHVDGQEIDVTSREPLPVEVDGDVVGDARRVRFRVQPRALLVRCS